MSFIMRILGGMVGKCASEWERAEFARRRGEAFLMRSRPPADFILGYYRRLPAGRVLSGNGGQVGFVVSRFGMGHGRGFSLREVNKFAQVQSSRREPRSMRASSVCMAS
jgi:hypothetical protein